MVQSAFGATAGPSVPIGPLEPPLRCLNPIHCRQHAILEGLENRSEAHPSRRRILDSLGPAICLGSTAVLAMVLPWNASNSIFLHRYEAHPEPAYKTQEFF